MHCNGQIFLFIEDKTTKNGEAYRAYSTSVDALLEDGTKLYKNIDVRFTGNVPAEKLAKLDPKYYHKIEIDGWLSVRQFTRKDGTVAKEIFLMVNAVTKYNGKVELKPRPEAKKPDDDVDW